MIKGSKQTEETKRKIGLASEGRISWNKGKHFPEEYRKKLSESHKGKKLPEEQKRKISESLKGKKVSEETRRRLSEVLKGKKREKPPWNKGKKGVYSPEQSKRMSEAHKGQIAWNKGLTKETDSRMKSISEHIISIGGFNRGKSWNKGKKMGKPSWIKGKHHSKETRRKISEANKGKKLSEEGIRKLVEANKGKKRSEETKRKISLSNKGRKRSEESKERNRFAHLGKTPWNKGIHMWENKVHPRGTLGKISSRKGKKMSEEYKKKLSEAHVRRLSNPELKKRQSEISTATLLRLYESGKFPGQANTKPERQVKKELIKRGYKEGIDFVHQYKFMNKFMCDFCFPKQKLVIEVDGDFWHANPKKYPDQAKLHKHQVKGIGRDKSKSAYISKVDNGTWNLLRFWESDINKNVAECVDRIEEVLVKKKDV